MIRGSKYVQGIRIEYFEKPLEDLYLSIDNDYQNQNNALLSIVGTAKIIFDKTGDLKTLQVYALEKFSKPLPPLDGEDAKEYVSIINNRMEKLRKAAEDDSPYFFHLYHLTIEKIRKFYHKLKGLPEVQTSKVFRVYTDEGVSLNKEEKLDKVNKLFEYSKKNVKLNEEDYRILIKSRNK